MIVSLLSPPCGDSRLTNHNYFIINRLIMFITLRNNKYVETTMIRLGRIGTNIDVIQDDKVTSHYIHNYDMKIISDAKPDLPQYDIEKDHII